MKFASNKVPDVRSFNVIGVVLISDDGPSFGTPVFCDANGDAFIQSSSSEIKIDSFFRVPFDLTRRKGYAPLRLNESVAVDDPFLIGFRDIHDALFVYNKPALEEKLTLEFEYYSEKPFLWFAIARFLADSALINKVCDAPAIRAALDSREIEVPAVTGGFQLRGTTDREDHSPLVERQLALLKAAFEKAPTDPRGGFAQNHLADQADVAGGGWTEARVELLKELWEKGLTATQIAYQLGGKINR